MDSGFLEKRREPRQPAQGSVSFRLVEAPAGRPIEGRLIDVSRHGFRAAHGESGLVSGQEVYFQHAAAGGRARVAWNRIVAGAVESGFFILGI